MHRPEEKIGKKYAGNKYFRTMSYITDLISWCEGEKYEFRGQPSGPQ